MSYTIEHAKQIPIDILKQCIRSKIEWSEQLNRYDLELFFFAIKYTGHVTLEELSDDQKSLKDVFQGKWVAIVGELHGDLITGNKCAIGDWQVIRHKRPYKVKADDGD